YMPTDSPIHLVTSSTNAKVVCPRFRARQTGFNPLTSMFASPTLLMCPSTAEPGINRAGSSTRRNAPAI
ncbi:MAG: hypothetical protein ACRDIL_00950, partial [Candidatus Limnocylindrales bacterium]